MSGRRSQFESANENLRDLVNEISGRMSLLYAETTERERACESEIGTMIKRRLSFERKTGSALEKGTDMRTVRKSSFAEAKVIVFGPVQGATRESL